ncbi:DUF4405 domain-containing protein, partial [bacterium]|nr:DUF4405 domain-containing protein [bacterium]
MNIPEIKQNRKRFNKRAFISMGMFVSGLGLPISGVMNHFLAYDTKTIERHAWMSVHNILGLLFIIFAILHIIYNWNALIKYVTKMSKQFISKEAFAAIL